MITDKARLVEKLYGIAFILFVVAASVAIIDKNFGSAIWMGLAASNCVSLTLWAGQKRRFESLEKTLNKILSEKS